MKYYLLTFNEDHGDEHDVPALACMNEQEFQNWSNAKQDLHAYLGNNSDYFAEDLQGKTGNELIEQKYVDVYEVDQSFKKVFDLADLGSLSLCTVFEENDNYY